MKCDSVGQIQSITIYLENLNSKKKKILVLSLCQIN